ncbi:unnamed protein product [Calicophoron daubneyi]
MVDSLRRCNLDLQMSLENVSLKYNEEIEKRNNINKEIILVKGIAESVETKLNHLEAIRTEIVSNCVLMKERSCALNTLYSQLESAVSQRCQRLVDNTDILERKLREQEAIKSSLEEQIILRDRALEILEEEKNNVADQLQLNYGHFQREIDRVSTENAEIRATAELYSEENQTFKLKLSESDDLITHLQRDITELRLNAQLKDKLLEESELKMRDLEDNLKNKTDALDRAESLVANQESKLAHAERVKSATEDHLHQIQETLENLKNQRADESESLNQRLCSLRTRINTLSELTLKREEIHQRIYFDASAIKDKIKLTEELREIDRQNLKRQAGEIEDLRKLVSTLSEENNGLKVLKGKLETDLKDVKIEYELLQNKLQKLEQNNHNMSSEMRRLEEENSMHIEEKSKLARQLVEVQAVVEKAEEESAEAKLQNQTLINELDSYKSQLVKAKEESSELHECSKHMEDHLKEKERELQKLSARINILGKEADEASLKIGQMCQSISDLTLQLEYARQELSVEKMKQKGLQEQLARKDKERNDLLERSETQWREKLQDIQNEKQQVESDLKDSAEKIKSLQLTIDSKKTETSRGNKKLEKKIADTLSQLEKYREQIKDMNNEKKELCKTLNGREKEIIKLQEDAKQRKEHCEEIAEEKKVIFGQLEQAKLENEKKQKAVDDLTLELNRLKKIEQEYKEFQHQIYANSPPASTQLPAEIGVRVTQTPKSPALSVRLNSLSLLKTPQTTPRSILKQPGSARKRRRVFFAPQPDDTDEDQSPLASTEVDFSKEGIQEAILIVSPQYPTTPKPQTRQIQSPDKTSNIRKTPRKKEPKFNESKGAKQAGKGSVEWFECDRLFGVGVED